MVANNSDKDIFTDKGQDYERFISLCEEKVFPPIDLAKYEISEDVLSFIPERIARAYRAIPIARMGYVLTVAMRDPSDLALIDNLRFITQFEIAPVISLPQQITNAIDKYYSLRDKEGVQEPERKEAPQAEISSFKEQKFNLEEITKLSKATKVVNLVNDILAEAVKSRTSDIHIEPLTRKIRVRYRIDGMLHDSRAIEKRFQEAVIARVKLMSRLDITQRRAPQDGRFGFHSQGKDIDVRVSILPVDFGEKIVLRLLNKASIKLDIESLGFSPYALDAFKQSVAKPFGMILLTGPTGSGKTTTLYALLNQLNTVQRNISTIEDPVEYNLAGITQVPVRHEIGLGFATILRATLRQSPDIIMVGEIRDFETVDIAMKAALTGHIVFSTLHTNDAPSAVTRLLNMGVEPFLIASSLNMIAAQRLVRKICPMCKTSFSMDTSQLQDIPSDFRKKDLTLYKGEGCSECSRSGYKGRVAVVEALMFNDELRDMVMKQASSDNIRDYAKQYGGMKTLREDAMDKCVRGETTFEEALRVTVEF